MMCHGCLLGLGAQSSSVPRTPGPGSRSRRVNPWQGRQRSGVAGRQPTGGPGQQFPDQLKNGLNHADLVEAFLLQLYAEQVSPDMTPVERRRAVPPMVLVPALPTGADLMEQLLADAGGNLRTALARVNQRERV